jgi:transcriptional regulator GlxA family with amidase domain
LCWLTPACSNGKRATTHWNSVVRLAAQFPAIEVEPDAIYVKDGSIYTSAGVLPEWIWL